MVGLGFFQLALLATVFWARWRGVLERTRWLLWTLVFSALGAVVCNHAGWCAAELGRQPWTVYGLLRTSDSLSKSVTAGQVMSSLVGFGLVYLFLFAVWIFVMADKIKAGPDEPA